MAWKTDANGNQTWVPDDPQGASKYGFYTDRDGERWAVDDNYQHWYYNPAEGGWFQAQAGNSPYYTAEGWFDTRPTKAQVAQAAKEKADQAAAQAAREKADAAARQSKLNWENSDPNTRSSRYLTDDMRAFYTHEDPQAYLRQFVGDISGGNTESNRAKWMQGQYGDIWAEYQRAAETNDNLLFPDFLTGNYGKKLSNQFDGLGWRDRGEAAPTLNAGRIVW